jgi:hypothetical protein
MADLNNIFGLNDLTEPNDQELLDSAELAAELVGPFDDQEIAQADSGVNGFFQFLAVIAGIAILTVIFRQPTDAVRMRQDLHRITMQIEKADIRLDQKESLLDEIEAIRKGLQAGASVPPASWLEAKESIESLLQGGITDEKLRLIEREFARINNEIYETEK